MEEIKEIGGNKILLEDKGIKIFCMIFGKRGEFFGEFLTPRSFQGKLQKTTDKNRFSRVRRI